MGWLVSVAKPEVTIPAVDKQCRAAEKVVGSMPDETGDCSEGRALGRGRGGIVGCEKETSNQSNQSARMGLDGPSRSHRGQTRNTPTEQRWPADMRPPRTVEQG